MTLHSSFTRKIQLSRKIRNFEPTRIYQKMISNRRVLNARRSYVNLSMFHYNARVKKHNLSMNHSE